MVPTVLGLAIGLAISLTTHRIVESMLYGTSPRDAATFVTVFAVLVACAFTACLIPARKAAGIDPAVTLRV